MCLIRSGQGKVLPPALQRSNTFLCVPPESSRIPTLISTTSSEVSWKSVRKRLLKEVMGARQRRSGAGLSDQPPQDSPTVSRERSQRIERPAHGATPTLICQLMRTERLRLRLGLVARQDLQLRADADVRTAVFMRSFEILSLRSTLPS